MPRYSAFIGVQNGPGHYQELEDLIDAPDPRSAAQRALEQANIHPDDQFPQVLIVEEAAVSVYSRDGDRHVVTPDEDFPRLVSDGPATILVEPPAPTTATLAALGRGDHEGRLRPVLATAMRARVSPDPLQAGGVSKRR